VLVSSGTYSESVTIKSKNGSASAPLVVRAADGPASPCAEGPTGLPSRRLATSR
jgi:hypothetical protein